MNIYNQPNAKEIMPISCAVWAQCTNVR